MYTGLDRLYPFGSLHGDSELQFADRDDGYLQILLNEKFLYGAVFYDSIFVSFCCRCASFVVWAN